MKKIKKNREFQFIYNNAKKQFGKYSLIFFNKNNESDNKFGFVASKKVGNAIKRNRVKRLFKEYIKNNEKLIKKSYNIIIISKKNIELNMKYDIIEKDLNNIFKNANLL